MMSKLPERKPDAVFQQDGVPSHLNNEVTTFLNELLPQYWIGWGQSPFLINLSFSVGLYKERSICSTNARNFGHFEGKSKKCCWKSSW
jgi:hypothetical protein